MPLGVESDPFARRHFGASPGGKTVDAGTMPAGTVEPPAVPAHRNRPPAAPSSNHPRPAAGRSRKTRASSAHTAPPALAFFFLPRLPARRPAPRAEQPEADHPRQPDEDGGKIAPPAHPPRCPDQQQTAHHQQHRRPCPPAPTTCTEQQPAAHRLPCQTPNSPQPKAQSTAHRQPYTPAASLSRQNPAEQPKTPRPGPAPEGSDSLLYATTLPKYSL